MGKVLNISELEILLIELKTKNIVFTNGCFDILHPGHIHILEVSKSHGDILIVGVNSDDSIKKLKGPLRPKIPQGDRLKILSSLKEVDYVVMFEEDSPLKLIKQIKPNIIVKGGDYNLDNVVGGEFVKSNGGQVKIVKLLEGYSSSSLIDNFEN